MLTPLTLTCKRGAILAAALSLAACASVETQSFRVVPDPVVESAVVAADADFTRYTQLLPVDMGVFFPENAATTADDIRRIRDIFRAAFLAELGGYAIVDQPGPSAMTVQATLIDFRAATYQDVMSVAAELRDMAKPGKIVFLMEMRDSNNGRVLARAADSATAPSIADEQGETTDWASVEDAAAHWAALFRRFLDQNFGH